MVSSGSGSRGGQSSDDRKTNDERSSNAKVAYSNPDKQMSPDNAPFNDDYFIVKNPLVLLVCNSEYKGGWVDLMGVKSDRKTLCKLFQDFYGWKVESIENGTKEEIDDFFELHKAKVTFNPYKCKLNRLPLFDLPSFF